MKRFLIIIALTGALVGSVLADDIDSSQAKEPKRLCQGKHSNTGCFVGVSAGLSLATSRADITTSASFIVIEKQPKKESLSFPIAFDLGYQWYYAQNAGFRFKAYVGYENYSAKNMNLVAPGINDANFNLTSHALQYGLEARYLYDFIYGGEHTFGVNIGAGFEGSSFFNTMDAPDFSSSNPDARIVYNLTNYTKVAWTIGVGLHYFYKIHHQILLSYLYRGYTDELKGKTLIIPEVNTNMSISTFANHTIQLSYAYKF